jgi:hypothetical protein
MSVALTVLRERIEHERFERLRRKDSRTAITDSAAHGLAAQLKRRIDGEVRFDKGARAMYSTNGGQFQDSHHSCSSNGSAQIQLETESASPSFSTIPSPRHRPSRRRSSRTCTCGQRGLIPEVNKAATDSLIIADGFSCREQIGQLTNRQALHLAEVLQTAIRGGESGPVGGPPEAAIVRARRREFRVAAIQTVAFFAAGAVGAVLLANMVRSRRRES